MPKITPSLWYAKEAEEAAAFYTSVFPDSGVSRVTPGGHRSGQMNQPNVHLE